MSKQYILKSLEPLFNKAKEENLWFYTGYHGIWFSVKELKREHKKGKYIWHKGNWELRNPEDRICELERNIEYAKIELREFKLRLRVNS